MAQNDFNTESPSNYEQKCCCVLVLDVSGSMSGNPIQQLNNGLKDFYSEISQDSNTANKLEISIITFESKVQIIQEPALVHNFRMPVLNTGGSTKLVDGVRAGIQKVNDRKTWYKNTAQPYYRPWIIMITDGAPDSDQNVAALTQEINDGVNQKKFHFFAIGTDTADMIMLQKISSPAMPAAKLQGLKFANFFKWLSASMTAITSSAEGDKVDLAAGAENWMTGFQI